MIKAKQTIRCRFVKVSDSDNIRVVHVPKFWWLRGLGVNPGNWVTGPKPDADNSSSSNPPFKAWDWTLNIRLMGIDAPEVFNFFIITFSLIYRLERRFWDAATEIQPGS